MFWIKALSVYLSWLLLLVVQGLPTSVLIDSKTAALKTGTNYSINPQRNPRCAEKGICKGRRTNSSSLNGQKTNRWLPWRPFQLLIEMFRCACITKPLGVSLNSLMSTFVALLSPRTRRKPILRCSSIDSESMIKKAPFSHPLPELLFAKVAARRRLKWSCQPTMLKELCCLLLRLRRRVVQRSAEVSSHN